MVNKGRLLKVDGGGVGAAGGVLRQGQQKENAAAAADNNSEGAVGAGPADLADPGTGNPGSGSNNNPAALVNWRCGCCCWRWC